MAGKVKRELNHYDSLFGMTYIAWKERQTFGSLFENTLSLINEKILKCKKEGI